MNNSTPQSDFPKVKPIRRQLRFALAFILMASTTSAAYAQTTTTAADSLLTKDSLIERRLVELAWESPSLKRTESQNKVADLQLKKTRNSWLNLLTFSTSYNFQNLSQTPAGAQNVVVAPGLNAGITIPLGIIASKGSEIKISREQVKVAQLNREMMKREIKAEVLLLYRQYNNMNARLLMQNKVLVDEQAALLQSEKKFRDGMISIEAYNAAAQRYNSEVINRMNLELSQYQAKLNIEKIIGVPLESVLF